MKGKVVPPDSEIYASYIIPYRKELAGYYSSAMVISK
jgi:hypothetical protein